MEQVLDNLIENARKNVREGGEIRLTISCFEKEVSFFPVQSVPPPFRNRKFPKNLVQVLPRTEHCRQRFRTGLAIVAQVLSAYRVPYGVRNHKNGVEFYFSFPYYHMIPGQRLPFLQRTVISHELHSSPTLTSPSLYRLSYTREVILCFLVLYGIGGS